MKRTGIRAPVRAPVRTLAKTSALAPMLALLLVAPSLSVCLSANAQVIDVVVVPSDEPTETPRTRPKSGISLGGFSIPLGRRDGESSMRDRDLPEANANELVFTATGDPAEIAAAAGLDLIEAAPLRSLSTTLVVVSLRKGDSPIEAQRRLAGVAGVGDPQPNGLFQTMAGTAAPVPKRFAIHGLDASSQTVAGAADTPIDSTIAMIDTVVALDHEALRGARVEQTIFVADRSPRAHGTAVAGLIAGTSAEVPGVARGAKLLNFAAFTERKDGIAVATTANLAKALDAAAMAKPDALSLAFGGRDDRLLGLLVDEIDRRGVCIVAAAGNGGEQKQVPFPARHPAVLAATAIDNALKPYAHATRGDRIDVAAVGVDVFVAVPDGKRSAYRRMSGTSMATALVAGALLRSPTCAARRTPSTLRAQARAAARDLGAPGHDSVFGAGLFLLPKKISRLP